jgi:hypothetical protein
MFRVLHTVPWPRHDDAATVSAGVTDSPKWPTARVNEQHLVKAYLVVLSNF